MCIIFKGVLIIYYECWPNNIVMQLLDEVDILQIIIISNQFFYIIRSNITTM